MNANDSEADNVITYGIVTGSTADFDLDSDTGLLSTRGPLDREAVPQYILTIQAVDNVGMDGGGIDSRTSYAQVL